MKIETTTCDVCKKENQVRTCSICQIDICASCRTSLVKVGVIPICKSHFTETVLSKEDLSNIYEIGLGYKSYVEDWDKICSYTQEQWLVIIRTDKHPSLLIAIFKTKEDAEFGIRNTIILPNGAFKNLIETVIYGYHNGKWYDLKVSLSLEVRK